MSLLERVTGLFPQLQLDGDNVPLWNRLGYQRRKTAVRGMYGFAALIGLFLVLAPLYWMFVTAFTPRSEIFDLPRPLFPAQVTLEGFRELIFGTAFAQWYLNSLIVSVGVVTLTTVTSTLAGYGLTRIDIPRKKSFTRLILFGYMFPAILLAIPMFIFWRQIGWIDSVIGLTVGTTAISLPFSIWLMWKFFQTVPYSLEEAAYINGASRFRAFYEIALPMAKPGIVAVAVFSFAVAWNEFTIPQVLMVSEQNWVLTQGIQSLTVQNTVLWSQVMSACVLTLVPPFLFVYFLQKYLLRGFRAGGMG